MKLEKEVGILPVVTYYENSEDTFKGVTLMINIPELTKEEVEIITKGQVSKLKMTLEYQEPILEDEEKKYLSAVIKPFRDDVEYIKKTEWLYDDHEYIGIYTKNNFVTCLPLFKKGTMYKGMERGKEYSLKDLEL